MNTHRQEPECETAINFYQDALHIEHKRNRELVTALERVQKILGITDAFVPLGPALDCAPVIRAALKKAKGE